MKFNQGDEVVVVVDGEARVVRTVRRANEKHVWLTGDSDSRFRQDSGYAVARGVFAVSRIEPATQEHRDEIRRRSLAAKLRYTAYETLSLAVLEELDSVIAKARGMEGTK